MDTFVLAGQSNMSGRGTSNQIYSHATISSCMLGNDYVLKTLADPIDSNTGQVDSVSSDSNAGGSPWPLVATSMATNNSKSCLFVPCAKGDTSIIDWQPGADHEDRATLYGSMIYRAKQVGNVKAVLWWQGEREARADVAMSAEDYNTYLDTIANAVMDDIGCPLMPCKLQDLSQCTIAAPRDNTNVNLAIATAWADNDNVLAGPDFSDLVPVEDTHLHFTTDAEMATLADRWWAAIETAFGW